ncbi:hypothetical protein F2A37_10520 [Pseudomonas chlororaphis]|uniref:hypothetical protein n=1 Tax=Pseudomonas chlororaphis TaxID=587753 RepID=UPI001231F305|nr:hypothetical protein [Pseudomonas chlororaphis]KAA5845895.1 hypothetical protein F2A37_10520 [Pseudomonas chlororaphis]
MRFRSLSKWDNKSESKGLIFVAQLIDELMFDYTLDSYKPSAMNTALLVKEAVDTIVAIDAGIVMKPNLAHILKELCENLQSDEVARGLMSVDDVGVINTLANPKSSDASVTTVVKLLLRQIPLPAYKDKNEELLKEELLGGGQRSRLRKLTRSYITTLLNSGYTATYISKVSKKFFYYSPDRISGNEAIDDYFSFFSSKATEHFVVYKAPSYLVEFSEAAKSLGMDILESLENCPITEEDIRRHNIHLGNNEVFIFLEKVRGKEPNFIKIKSDASVEAIQTLIGLYHHKESPKPINECLVKNATTGLCTKIAKHMNPMHKCADAIPSVASKKLASFVKAFALDKESFKKFHRSAELHSLALASESIENQMINLWIALESLVPSKTDKDLAQIDHLTLSITPFLNLEYINKLLIRFFKDLLQWNRRFIREMYKKIDAQGISSKTAHLLALPEYQYLREELEVNFGDYHLLNDRYQYLVSLLSSPAAILNTLDNHQQRVAWQLRRIYRARNTIVHDGSTPSYTEVLIENTHDYLDSIMRWLMALASMDTTIISVAQGFKMVELNYLSYRKKLSEKNLLFTKGNIDSLLLRFQYSK